MISNFVRHSEIAEQFFRSCVFDLCQCGGDSERGFCDIAHRNYFNVVSPLHLHSSVSYNVYNALRRRRGENNAVEYARINNFRGCFKPYQNGPFIPLFVSLIAFAVQRARSLVSRSLRPALPLFDSHAHLADPPPFPLERPPSPPEYPLRSRSNRREEE